MKIVHVLNALIKGGGERVAVDLANHAAVHGHSVTVIAAWGVDPLILRNDLLPNVGLVCISSCLRSKPRIFIETVLWLLRNRIWILGQDIIHCHLSFGSFFGFLVSLIKRCPVRKGNRPIILETCHSAGMPQNKFKRWLRSKMIEQFDWLVLMANDLYWKHFGVKHQRLNLAIIENGFAFSRLVPLSDESKASYRDLVCIPEGPTLVVGTVSMLRKDRAPWVFLPVFADISREFGHRAHFLIAGDGSEYSNIKNRAADLGLAGNLHMPGLTTDVREPLSLIDLFITLNVGATTGIAGLEAAYLGVPVIAIQMDDAYAMSTEDWIWSSSNLTEVSKRATYLLNNPSERTQLARQQKQVVSMRYSIERASAEYFELYEKAIFGVGKLNTKDI